MDQPRQVAFGKRPHPPAAGAMQTPGKPWLIWMILGSLVVLVFGLVVPLLQRQQAGDHAVAFLAFSTQRPTEAKQYVLASIEPCLSDGARSYWSDPTVMNFAAEVMFKALSLRYADLSADQRDEEFREWLGSTTSHLTLDQQKQFMSLMDNGLHRSDTRECLAAKVHRLLQG